MKDAQDAVKEIREWPKLAHDYLVEHHDGSIGFVNELPPLMVCSREEFMEAKSGKPSWDDAPLGSNARVQDSMGYWHFGKFPPGSKYPKPTERGNWESGDGQWLTNVSRIKGTLTGDWRDTLERRLEAVADSVSEWNGEGYPPPETKCQFKGMSRTTGVRDFATIFEPCTVKYASEHGCYLLDQDGNERFMNSRDFRIEFRPLKSDRERWVEAAGEITNKVPITGTYHGAIYDALKSGELPMPEAK